MKVLTVDHVLLEDYRSTKMIAKIIVKNKKVYDCLKRSKHVRDWRWATGDSLAGWSPYYIGKVYKDTPIVLFVTENCRVTFGNLVEHPEYADGAIPWAQWCELKKEDE